MKKIVAELFKRPITKEQSKDTGMAMVLLLLLFSGASNGIDSLKLKDFKSRETSVMLIRNHIFTGKDIEKPY